MVWSVQHAQWCWGLPKLNRINAMKECIKLQFFLLQLPIIVLLKDALKQIYAWVSANNDTSKYVAHFICHSLLDWNHVQITLIVNSILHRKGHKVQEQFSWFGHIHGEHGHLAFQVGTLLQILFSPCCTGHLQTNMKIWHLSLSIIHNNISSIIWSLELNFKCFCSNCTPDLWAPALPQGYHSYSIIQRFKSAR